MSGPNKSYLPSQRMMPSFTTVSPPSDDGKASDYSYEAANNNNNPGGDNSQTTSPALTSPYSRIQESPKTVAELAYSRMQEFPYGISGVPMPSYNYNSELYNYVSNGFPRKSRMCSYCGKVFTRSTTRRYHEKRCPLLRAAGSLLSNNNQGDDRGKTDPGKASFATNASFPLAPQTQFYSGFPATLYHSTSAGLDQNRNHALLPGVKQEPQERKDSGSAERQMPRGNPDHEHPARQIFSPTSNHLNSPESRRSPQSPGGEDRDSLLEGEAPQHHKINTSASGEYELNPRFNHSGTSERDSPIVSTDTGQDRYCSDREPGERDPRRSLDSRMKNGDDDDEDDEEELSGITQGYKDDNELGEITPVDNTQCGLCGKVCATSRDLEAHCEQVHGNYKPYACRYCGERFRDLSVRAAHERSHVGERPHTCAICGLTFTRKLSVRIHMRRKHEDGACLCRYCGKTLFDLQSLKEHLLSHDLPKPERDSLLYLNTDPLDDSNDNNSISSDNNDDDGAATTAATTTTTTAVNGTSAEIVAQVAEEGEVLATPQQGPKDTEWCRLCEKDIPKSFLRYHERMHADQKPFECPLCKKRFGYKNNMKSHMKLHAGIKPYQCHICGAKFTRGSTLRRHARRHGIVTDSVWDFFTQKHGNKNADQLSGSGRGKPRTASPDVTSSRPGNHDNSTMLPDSSHSYDLASLNAVATSAASALYAGYGSLPSLPHAALYPPYSSTSLLQYAGYGHAPSSTLIQSDALNLSVTTPKIKLLANRIEDGHHARKPDPDLDEASRKSDSPTDAKPGCRNVAIQVKTCCHADAKGLDPAYDIRMMSPSSFESSGSVATSPSISSGTETLMNETLATLLSTGKMFRCSHCCSFFAEYAMYRIHQKLHARDASHPFMCPQCGEDCYDRMYFSLHLAEHLK